MAGAQAVSPSRFTAVLGVTAVSFFLCLLPFELIPEIPVDIDSKPFFVPLTLCALLPAGRTGLAIGLGVALGEGLRDMMEGYELDDPIGFVGYIVAFWAASAIYALAPFNRIVLVLGAILCGAVQAALEASSFLLFGTEGIAVAVQSAIGNTITHGVIWGAVPLLFLVPALHGKFERYLGYAPRGHAPGPPLPEPAGEPLPSESAVAALSSVSLRLPGTERPALNTVSFELRPGETVGLAGAEGSDRRSLALVLAGLAPEATGGECVGTVRPAASVAFISSPPGDYLTQPRALHEVAAAHLGGGGAAADSLEAAHAALDAAGLPREDHSAYVWSLDAHGQARVLMAAADVGRPALVVLDRIAPILGETADSEIDRLLSSRRGEGAALIIDEDAERLARHCDRVIVMQEGEIIANHDKPTAAELTSLQSRERDAPAGTDPPEPAEAAPVFVPTLQREREGWWQRRDPRVKWGLFIALIAMIYVAPDWRWMAAMVALGAVLALTARPSPLWMGVALLVQLPNVIGLVFLPLLGSGAEAGEELAFGLRLALGWVAAVLFGISLLSSMEIPEMVAGLKGIGLPESFAFTVGYSFLLIYLSLADFSRLIRRLRGPDAPLSLWRPFDFARFLAQLVVPAVTTVARRGGAMALALEARGPAARAVPAPPGALGFAEIVLVMLCVAALFAAAFARLNAI